ncbi:MAG: cupin domain-containing protein [Actinomycetota bacterium]|nr:cupin domain-containing protein [Actinomycetota bacterium]
MAAHPNDTVEVGYDEFCGALAAKDLQPLWTQASKLMPPEPIPATLPWLWKWRTVLPLAERAGQLIDITRGGDRRVLAFANPGLHGLPYTSSTLWGAFQYLGPHETAPAHRHSPAALRFVVEGDGVWTTVDGDACDMSAGDLILTPSGCWHDHTNGSDQPMVWFDGLDLPLVGALEAVFFELYPDLMQPVPQPHNLSERLYGGRGTQPLTASPSSHSPLLLYRWADTDATLNAMLEGGAGPIASLRYANPATGGAVMPTLGCEMHRIVPGKSTTPHRKVGSSIYVVFRGRGHSIINGQRFDWEPGDVFVTPSWSTVEHQADEPADLFAVTDRPVLEALHLFREECPAPAQQAVATFEPR